MPTVDRANLSIDELMEELATVRRQADELEAAIQAAQGESARRAVEYPRLVKRVQEAVAEEVPVGSTVLVVSKGDRELVELGRRRKGWHFPRAEDGRYAGYYPKAEISAVAHLEALRGRGADYLLFPGTAAWWLDHYPMFARHLDARYRRIDYQDVCAIFALRERPSHGPLDRLRELVEDLAACTADEPAVLDWHTGTDMSVLSQCIVFNPPVEGETLPYVAHGADIVVVATEDPGRLAEARRVASTAVVNLHAANHDGAVEVVAQAPQTLAPPAVSVIIPCFNGVELTRTCLATLLDTLPRNFRGEVLIVDDRSKDGTSKLARSMARADTRVRVIRNRKNLGFLGSCNRGAAEASGDYLVFLNNDTVLLPGWLPPLLRTFADYSDAGVVGGRLLYEDGRLQEAGCLVFNDASAAKIGYGDPDADAPIYRHVREVDYVSAALLATPRALFEELGGLDPRYGFGYYEDDDYCFAVRATGRCVYYQPEATIVHVEGATAGRDVLAGPKRQQVINRRVFAEKWSDALRLQPKRPEPLDRAALYRLSSPDHRYTRGGNA